MKAKKTKKDKQSMFFLQNEQRLPYARVKKGFTLIEVIVVVIILGIGAGMFYAVLGSNWMASEQHLSRADVWQELNRVVELVNSDGRRSNTILAPGVHSLVFSDNNGNPISQYTITAAGQVQRTTGIGTEILSDKADPANSSFVLNGRSVVMTLAMRTDVFGDPVMATTSVEIFPRN